MKEGDWLPPIIKTVATRGEGVEELIDAIERHRQYVIDSGQLEQKRRRHLRDEVLDFVAERARRRADKKIGAATDIGRRIAEAPMADLDPYSIASDIINSDG
jgi:LAO/AO transport system kinase